MPMLTAVATAIRDDKKAAIAKAAGVTDEQLAGKNVIETEITVKVEAKTADLANGKLTFEASPVATVKVNGAATGTTVPVTNAMLNGKPITVKLPLPAGFTPSRSSISSLAAAMSISSTNPWAVCAALAALRSRATRCVHHLWLQHL